MMIGKKGDEKYYILMSMILGLIILSLSLYFIFQEYFDEEVLDREACRQSIVLRNLLPVSDRPLSTFIESSKNLVPLKCKTEVVVIDDDPSVSNIGPHVMKQIADVMVDCWSLFGKGDSKLFPVNFVEERRDCAVCARIHFTEELKDRLLRINLGEYLNFYDLEGKWDDGMTNTYSKYFNKKASEDTTRAYFFVRLNNEPFKLPDNKEFVSGDYGVRNYLTLADGDLLVGMYFYSNREYFTKQNILGATRYQFNHLFYAQPSKDNLNCHLDSIPA